MSGQMAQLGDKMVVMNATSVHRFTHIIDLNEAVHTQSKNERTVRLARLAMLIECEGSITIGMTPPTKTRNRPALTPMVSITNTAEQITDEAIETLIAEGIGLSSKRRRPSVGLGKKMRTDVHMHAFDRTEKLLTTILPYLRSKKRQAELVLEFIKSRRSAAPKAPYSDLEWRLTTDVRLLNHYTPQRRALAKAKAYLESPESLTRPRAAGYFRKYVEMCNELQAAL